MFIDYSNNNITVISKKEYEGIKYNTKFDIPENTFVYVVENGDYKDYRELTIKNKNDIINPHKVSLFGSGKIDDNKYIVYTISKSKFDATTGCNIEYQDENIPNIAGKVFIRISYKYQFTVPQRAFNIVSSQVGGSDNDCDNEYINIKINRAIEGKVRECVSGILRQKGCFDLQSEAFGLKEKVKEMTTDTTLDYYGIDVSNFNVELEADENLKRSIESYRQRKAENFAEESEREPESQNVTLKTSDNLRAAQTI